MSMSIEEIKTKIESLNKGLNNPNIQDNIKEGMKLGIQKLQKQLEELESKAGEKVEEAKQNVEKAEEKIEEAQQKVEEATTPAEKKEAKEELATAKEEKKEATEEVKEAAQEVKEVAKVADKADAVAKKHGGKRPNAGRKRKIEREQRVKGQHGGSRAGAGRKASSPIKMVKPKGYQGQAAPLVRKKKKHHAVIKTDKHKDKVKSVRAFGQKVEYKNDAEFCKKLIGAFKKRKKLSKAGGKRRRTKPVFGVIVSSTKNAVSKALHSVSTKKIESNPKQYLAKAQRLEKSAIRFLNDFKEILGSDYKQSEITSEFGELEKAIKQFVQRVAGK